MILFENKKWQLSITRNFSFFHGFADTVTNNDRKYFEKFNLIPRRQVCISEKGVHTSLYNNKEELEKYNIKIEENCLKKGWIEDIENVYYETSNYLLDASKSLVEDQDCDSWLSYVEAYYHLVPGLFMTAAIGRHMFDVLVNELKIMFPAKKLSELEAFAGDITYPNKITPLAESQVSLLDIGSDLQSKGLNVGEINKDKDIYGKFISHFDKYSIIPANYNDEPWSQEDMLLQLKQLMMYDCRKEKKNLMQNHQDKINTSKKILDEINDEKINLIAKSLQVGTYLNEYRKNVISRASLAHRPLFRRLAIENGVENWKILWRLNTYELTDLICKGNNRVFDVAKKRNQVGVIATHQEPRGFRYLSEKEIGVFKNDQYRTKGRSSAESASANESFIKGMVANRGKVSGRVKVVLGSSDFDKFEEKNILVATMTSVDFVPIMKKASAYVTNEGGITSHAAIISREYNKPCIIGTKIATQVLKDGDLVEVDADEGVVKIIKRF